MLKYLVVLSLFLSSAYVHADDLAGSLYQIELNKPLHEIKNVTKTSMKGLYSIEPSENQLPKPLIRLLVKVNSQTSTVVEIIGEADIAEHACGVEAKKQKEKYEELFSLKMEEMKHQGDLFYFATKADKLFIIGCENKRKTILRVLLSNYKR